MIKQLLKFCVFFIIIVFYQNTNAQQATWTGASDNAWNNINNWDTGVLPDASTKVIIPNGLANYPILADNVTIKELIFNSNAATTAASLDFNNFTLNTGTLTVLDWTNALPRKIGKGTGQLKVDGKFFINGRNSQVIFNVVCDWANKSTNVGHSQILDAVFEKEIIFTERGILNTSDIIIGGEPNDLTIFNGKATFVIDSPGRLLVAGYESTVNFNENVVIKSTVNADDKNAYMVFGFNNSKDANINLADGKELFADDFSFGNLQIYNVTQTGTTKTHTHNLKVLTARQFHMQKNLLLGNIEINSKNGVYRNNTFNTDVTNTTNIKCTPEKNQVSLYSGGNIFKGITKITHDGRGDVFFGHNKGGKDIFETDAYFEVLDNLTPSHPPYRVYTRVASYSTGRPTTGLVTTYPTSVDYISKPYYVYREDPANWAGSKIGFADYPRATNLSLNGSTDPAVNAANAALNQSRDVDNKADETASENNYNVALINLTEVRKTTSDSRRDLEVALSESLRLMDIVTGDPGYSDPLYNASIQAKLNQLVAIRNNAVLYYPTISATYDNVQLGIADPNKTPGELNQLANQANQASMDANDQSNKVWAAVNALFTELNTQNANYNATLSTIIADSKKVGKLSIATDTPGNEFKGKTFFTAKNKGKLEVAVYTNAVATFNDVVTVNNESIGNGTAISFAIQSNSKIVFNKDITYHQDGKGNILSGRSGDIQFKGNLNIKNNAKGATIFGGNLIGSNILIENDIDIELNHGVVNLSNINKTSTTPLVVDAKNDSSFEMKGISTIRGDVTFIDHSSKHGMLISPDPGQDVTFKDNVSLKNAHGSEWIRIATAGNVTFNKKVTLENTVEIGYYLALAMSFGEYGGKVTLNNGASFEIGSEGFRKGRLLLRNINQIGNTPQSLIMDGSPTIPVSNNYQQFVTILSSVFEGKCRFEAPILQIVDSKFKNETKCIVWNWGPSFGGNEFFNKTFFTFRSQLVGYSWNFDGQNDNTYHDDVTFSNLGKSTTIRLGLGATNSKFLGSKLTIINGTGADQKNTFLVSSNKDSKLVIDSEVIIDNRASRGAVIFGEKGETVFNKKVTLQNALTNKWEGSLYFGTDQAKEKDGKVIFETTSSLTLNSTTTWEKGDLVFYNTNVKFNTPIDFKLESALATNLTRIFLGRGSVFTPSVSASSAAYFLNGATFKNKLKLEKAGPHGYTLSEGGCTFEGDVHLINSSSHAKGEILLANSEPDNYKSNVIYDIKDSGGLGKNLIVPAYNNIAIYRGTITIESEVNDDFYFNATGMSTPITLGEGKGIVRFAGSGTQIVTNNITNPNRVLRIRQLEMKQSSPSDLLKFNRDFVVTHYSEFTTGKIDLGNQNMTIENSNDPLSVLVLNINNSHVIATGAGHVIRQVNNNNINVIFPVGTSSTYTPATMKQSNSGTTDIYKVRLLASVSSKYNGAPNYTPSGVPIISHFTNATWIIAEEVDGGTDAELTLQWDPAVELTYFDRKLTSILVYNNTTNKWRCTQQAGATVGTPGTSLRREQGKINFVGAFSVATVNAEAGPDQTICGTRDIKMNAIPFTTPFKGKWTKKSGPEAVTITDDDSAETVITGFTPASSNKEYVFVWTNSGLEGDCGDENLKSEVKITFGAGSLTTYTGLLTWNGSTDSDWFNCENWTPNYIPHGSNVVKIPSVSTNNPDIDGTGANCKTLEVQNGAVLSLSSIGALKVNEDAKIISGGKMKATSTTSSIDILGDFSNAGDLNIASVIKVGGNCTNSLNISLDNANATIKLYGNFTNNNNINFNQGKVAFNGDDAVVGGTGKIALFDAEIDKNAGKDLTLNREISIAGNLNLVQGLIHTSSSNKLVVLDNATATQGKATSFIEGPMRKIGDDAFVFPVGKGNKWARIAIKNLNNSNIQDYFDAEYFFGNNPTTPVLLPLDHVSSKEHWDLTRGNTVSGTGTTQARVELYWENGTWSEIEETSSSIIDLTVAHWNGSAWEDLGGTPVGNLSKGFITSVVTQGSFSPFTFGSFGGNSPLPMNLISFKAKKNVNNTVDLSWVTSSERFSSHFEIERSNNLVDFENIGAVKAQGNAQTVTTYEKRDEHPKLGKNYYRLKMISQEGSVEYSDVRVVEFTEDVKLVNAVYPNPFYNNLNLDVNLNKGEKYLVEIKDDLGRTVYQLEGLATYKGIHTITLALSHLAEASYVLSFSTNTGRYLHKIIKLNE